MGRHCNRSPASGNTFLPAPARERQYARMDRQVSLLPSMRQLRLALLMLLLAATSAQQLVAQTHWHYLPGVSAAVAAPSDESGAGTTDSCLLCQIASHAGTAAPPAEFHLFVVSPALVAEVVSYHQADVPVAPAHAWQSRGPPGT